MSLSSNHKLGAYKNHESGFFEDNLLPEYNGGGGGGGPVTSPGSGSSNSNPLLAMMTSCKTISQPHLQKGPSAKGNNNTNTTTSSQSDTRHSGLSSSAAVAAAATNKMTSSFRSSNNNNKAGQPTTFGNHSRGLQGASSQKTREDSNNNSVILVEENGGDGDRSTKSDKENHDRAGHSNEAVPLDEAGGDRKHGESSESVIFTGMVQREDHDLEEASRIRTKGEKKQNIPLPARTL